MKALAFGIIYIIVVGSIFNVMGVFADTLDRVRDRDAVFKYEKSMGVHKNDTSIYVYVFNDETQLWNRAREETLKNATCAHLHTYVIGGGK
jgi:hypothetical protein